MRILLALCGLLVLTAAPRAQDEAPSGHAVVLEVGGPYLIGGGLGYEGRPHSALVVRAGAGVRTYSVLGRSHWASSVAAAGLVGTGRVGAEGGAGLTLAFPRRRVRDDGGEYQIRRARALAPHVSGGVRLSLPFGRTVSGDRSVDIVFRLGYTVVFDYLGGDLDTFDAFNAGVGVTL